MSETENTPVESVIDRKKVRVAMVHKDINQSALAEQMNTTPQRLSNWLRGKGNPTSANLLKMAQVLGVRLDDVVIDY